MDELAKERRKNGRQVTCLSFLVMLQKQPQNFTWTYFSTPIYEKHCKKKQSGKTSFNFTEFKHNIKIRIKIRLNTVLTLTAKQLLIIYKHNLSSYISRPSRII